MERGEAGRGDDRGAGRVSGDFQPRNGGSIAAATAPATFFCGVRGSADVGHAHGPRCQGLRIPDTQVSVYMTLGRHDSWMRASTHACFKPSQVTRAHDVGCEKKWKRSRRRCAIAILDYMLGVVIHHELTNLVSCARPTSGARRQLLVVPLQARGRYSPHSLRSLTVMCRAQSAFRPDWMCLWHFPELMTVQSSR